MKSLKVLPFGDANNTAANSYVTSDGSLFVVINKIDDTQVDDGKRRVHLLLLSPVSDLEAYLAAVNAQLGKPEYGSFPAISTDDWQPIRNKATATWTPAVIDAWNVANAPQEES